MTRHTTDGEPGSRSDAATAARPASEPEGGRIGVSGVQVAAGVLASVSAAMVSSYFGVAGTIVGAAVFSIFATVGSAAYGLGIRRTTARLQQVQTLRMPRPTVRLPGRGTPAERTGASTGEAADDEGGVDAAEAEAVDERAVLPGPATEGWRHWLARRRWSLAAGVAVVFVLSLATVTLIEAVADRPLSGEDSGSRATSIGSLFSGGGDDDEPDDPGTPTTTTPTPDDPSSDPSSGEEGEQLPSTTAPESDEPGAPPSPTTSTTAPTTTTTAPTTTATFEPAAPPPVTESEPAPEVAAEELTAPAG